MAKKKLAAQLKTWPADESPEEKWIRQVEFADRFRAAVYALADLLDEGINNGITANFTLDHKDGETSVTTSIHRIL